MKFIPPNTWKVTPMKKQNRVTLNHDKVYKALSSFFDRLATMGEADVYETSEQEIYSAVTDALGIKVPLSEEEKEDVLELAKDFGSFYWELI